MKCRDCGGELKINEIGKPVELYCSHCGLCTIMTREEKQMRNFGLLYSLCDNNGREELVFAITKDK